MIGCPSDPVHDMGTAEPNFDCRVATYQCAEGFTCEPIGSGEFTCIRSSTTRPPGDSDVGGIEPSAGWMSAGSIAGEADQPDDCRLLGCPSNEICTTDDYGGYACLETSECSNNNGGCGDPYYTMCIEESEGNITCIDIEECEVNNGDCGDPDRFFCVERYGAPPTCNEISYAEAPNLLGTYSEMYNIQGSSDIVSCHIIYMPTNYGLADTDGGCETCSYAWDISFNLVYNSCDIDEVTRSFDMPMGIDMINRQVMIKVNGTWGVFGGENAQASLSNKSASLTVFERDPYGPTSGRAGDVYTSTQFVGLTWEKESVSCGDSYCDYGDFSCSEDCLPGQNPATGYRFRTYGFIPDRGEYQHCFSVGQLSARNREPASGCRNCSEEWHFRVKDLITNCGSWSNPVGTTRRLDLGSRDRDQMVFYHSSRDEWMNVGNQYSEYLSEYNSLIASWDAVGYEDIDDDGRRDSNEPTRARSQLVVVHHE